jgi:hypothetical protein
MDSSKISDYLIDVQDKMDTLLQDVLSDIVGACGDS